MGLCIVDPCLVYAYSVSFVLWLWLEGCLFASAYVTMLPSD